MILKEMRQLDGQREVDRWADGEIDRWAGSAVR